MFKVLRKLLMVLLVTILVGVAWFCLHNPVYRRELTQKAEEVQESIKQDKKPFTWSGTAVVVDAVDGDRAKLDTEAARGLIVHLAGVDAPELGPDRWHKGQPLAEESRQFLSQLIKGKAVDMVIVGTDSTKQHPLVLLRLEGQLINAKLAEAGMAETTAETSEAIPAKLRHAIVNAEISAKEKCLGIWGLTNYVRPVEYRIRAQH